MSNRVDRGPELTHKFPNKKNKTWPSFQIRARDFSESNVAILWGHDEWVEIELMAESDIDVTAVI